MKYTLIDTREIPGVGTLRKYLWLQFVAGVMRGVGITVGVALFGALLAVMLRQMVDWQLPMFSGFLAEIIREVQQRL